MFMEDIARISVISKTNKNEIGKGIELFSIYLQKKWGIQEEFVSNLVGAEFYDPKSFVLKAEGLGKFMGVVCVAPFEVINFPDTKEKDKLLDFFEGKKIKPQEIIHIGGLGLDYGNLMIDLIWWSRFLIFVALKTSSSQGWKYAVGQTKADDTVISKLAKNFRFRELPIKTFFEGVSESWFLKKLY